MSFATTKTVGARARPTLVTTLLVGTPCIAGQTRFVYEYDNAGEGYSLGRLARVLQYDESNQLERKRALFYDQRGRLVKEETFIYEAGAPSEPFVKNWTYDTADRLASLTYPAEKNGKHERITYSYNNYGQLSPCGQSRSSVCKPCRV